LVYGMHSASLIALPFVRPRLYEKAQVKLRPPILAILGLLSLASMGYLTVVTIARGMEQRPSLPPDQRGIAICQLRLLWVVAGTVFYGLARWKGSRAAIDYQRQIAKAWAGD